ncbi:hypothetical protein [Phycisphaera mikurensis]|uniref:HicB-like antitoxin of toxin-antitoxin system domain-containing protein n=1 Tax=Phycisphaera mikurensis (strain NBRC 102666 / KCTC 22515 / FYK2301M01) TaxID=1142394 RepID=I0IA98_PHYMF|nr:hypothetical protein [Phycisphaera mikurensis]MBB6441814.1 putative RNase H-like HicB family nuclease [Phycisphaera mikurensis]BAM02186.1 hypothetical protein PSMK_00270 [Phycisphaera mikurensis NBRC 102666]
MTATTQHANLEITYIITPPDEGETGFHAACAEFYEANGEGPTEATAIANLEESLLELFAYRRAQAMKRLPEGAVCRKLSL